MEFCFACGDDIHAPATCAQAATWREEEDSNMEEKKEASKDAQVRKKERKRGRRRGREERKKLPFIHMNTVGPGSHTKPCACILI